MPDEVLDNLFDDDVELVHTVTYRFQRENFFIEVDTSTGSWYAIHEDEEIWEDAEILTDMVEDIELFDEYLFTIEEFESLKSQVQEHISETDTNEVQSKK